MAHKVGILGHNFGFRQQERRGIASNFQDAKSSIMDRNIKKLSYVSHNNEERKLIDKVHVDGMEVTRIIEIKWALL